MTSPDSKPDEVPDFNVFVGAASGLLKGVSVDEKGVIGKNLNSMKTLNTGDDITCMSWDIVGCDAATRILVGLRNGAVKTYDAAERSFVTVVEPQGGDPLVGVARCDGIVVTATEGGIVRAWRGEEEDEKSSVDAITHQLEKAPGTKLNRGGGGGGVGASEEEEEESMRKHLAQLRSNRSLCRMVQSPHDPRTIATGGRESELCLWDASDLRAPTFRSKNVRPDKLQLRVPVWISDVAFFPSCDRTVAAVGRHGHVRLYDVRVGGQRRPVSELSWPGEAPTAAVATSDRQLVVGCGTGHVALFDFRKPASSGVVRKYKGCVGSVRSVAASGSGSHFATVGLDRYLRIYDVNLEKPTSKIYLKSKLNCVLLPKRFDPGVAVMEKTPVETGQEEAEVLERGKEDEVSLESDEKFWTKLKVVRDGKKKMKRKGPEVNAVGKRKK